jgi:pyruvate-formate lyase-activating enzyme
MFEPERKRCPWCTNPEACSGCSLSGDDPEHYVLVPQAQVKEQLRKVRRRWATAVSVLLGMLLASFFALGLLLSWVSSW